MVNVLSGACGTRSVVVFWRRLSQKSRKVPCHFRNSLCSRWLFSSKFLVRRVCWFLYLYSSMTPFFVSATDVQEFCFCTNGGAPTLLNWNWDQLTALSTKKLCSCSKLSASSQYLHSKANKNRKSCKESMCQKKNFLFHWSKLKVSWELSEAALNTSFDSFVMCAQYYVCYHNSFLSVKQQQIPNPVYTASLLFVLSLLKGLHNPC